MPSWDLIQETKRMSNRPLVYIAGPFRAKTPFLIEENIRSAERIGLKVCEYGAVALIPHTMYRFFQNSLPDDFWLDAGLDLLRKCDAIVMGPGWTTSTGSCREREVAVLLKLPVFDFDKETDRLFPHWVVQFGLPRTS